MVTTIKPPLRDYLYISEHLEALGLKDAAFAKKLKTNRTNVWRWRNKQTRLTPKKIATIARELGLQPEDLWRPPQRPSVDALLHAEDDEIVNRAVEIVTVLLKTVHQPEAA